MMKRILVGSVATVLGIVGGMIFMMLLHMASTVVYPLPEGVDFMSPDPENQAKFKEWLATLPAGAFLLAAASHAGGCLIGVVVAMLVSRRTMVVPAVLVGLFFTVSGIANLFSIPHPMWFPFVDLPGYIIAAGFAVVMLRKTTSLSSEQTETSA